MGYRLHARKVNKIEYGDIAAFNGSCVEDINSMIAGFTEDLYESEDGSELEMPKADFKAGIQGVRAMSDEEYAEEYGHLAGVGYTRDVVVGILEGFLAEADPDNDEICLDWF